MALLVVDTLLEENFKRNLKKMVSRRRPCNANFARKESEDKLLERLVVLSVLQSFSFVVFSWV